MIMAITPLITMLLAHYFIEGEDLSVFKIIGFFRDDFRSTWPASIAFAAAALQGRELGNRYLRALRIAAAAERQGIHRRSVQDILAKQVGLDLDQFQSDMDSGRAEQALKKDLAECRQQGIHSFPSYLLRNAEGKEILLPGFTSFDKFILWIEDLATDCLERREIAFGLTEIHTYIATKTKVALREIVEIFGVGENEASDFMRRNIEDGVFLSQPSGSGVLYSLNDTGATCDAITGSCG